MIGETFFSRSVPWEPFAPRNECWVMTGGAGLARRMNGRIIWEVSGWLSDNYDDERWH